MAASSAMSSADFEMVKELGSGAFGSVAKVVRRADRQPFAMKRVQIGKMEEREVADALNECRILASVRHARIVNFECAFLGRGGRELCLVMELCERGDLAGRIKKCQQKRRRVDERAVWAHLVEMAEGLAYLHSKNISHRDLKPANVFLAADGTCKLGDLNVSKLTKGDDLMSTKIGTPYYMAPEVWNGKKYDFACDVWSLGCVVYELAQLEPPFQGNSLMQLRRAVNTGRYPPISPSYSPQLARVVQQLLVSDPSRRPRALQVLELDEVRRRRAQGLLGHPSDMPDEEGDAELMATIKPPRSRFEMRRLSEQLADMSAQVQTARSESKSALPTDRGGQAKPSAGAPGLPAMAEISEEAAAAEPAPAPAPAPLRAPGAAAAAPSRDHRFANAGAGGGFGARDEFKAEPRVAPHRAHSRAQPPPASHVPRRQSEAGRGGVGNAGERKHDDDPPLPTGWKMVPSQSRPGEFSYLNVNTGERVAERPTRPASAGGPLPPGWKKVPSQSRPGEMVYLNVNTGERIAWRPTIQNQRAAAVANGARGGGYAARPSYR